MSATLPKKSQRTSGCKTTKYEIAYCGSSSETSGFAFATGTAAAGGDGLTVEVFAAVEALAAVEAFGAADIFGEAAGGGFFADEPVGDGELAAEVAGFFGADFPATRYFRIFSNFFGPIPRIAKRSLTLLNGP